MKQKQHVLRTFQFWPKSLYPDLTGVAILLVDFFLVEFFNCWKYPSNSSETFKILFLHQNNQFEEKTACFADFSILTKIAVSGHYQRGHFVDWIFWLSFSNVENTLRILLKHSKFCSFIKTISLKQKQHVLRTFQFWPKSLYPDLTGVAILLVDFLVEFFKCWKYPSNSSETFKILFFHQNNQFEAKTACFADFSILTKIAVSGPYRRGHFVGWFFWLSFSNVENTLRILLKHSKFCSYIKTISLKQKQHVLRTFQFWPKSLYPGLTGVAIFLVDFLVENVENTLRILLKHSKFCSFIKTISLKQKQHVLQTFQFWPKSLYPDITGVAILLVDFFGWVFQMLKIPFEFFWNIQNFVLTSKQSVWSKNSMFCGLFNFDQNRCIRTLPAWPFFWLIFWNVENTLRILLKHSKFCSFIKTISLKQKQHVLRTFQFWPKSLYPDLTGVAILLVDFFGWVFQMLKIPFEFFWNIQNFVLSSKQSVWSKNSMFCGLFNFDQNRCIRTLPAWPFCWLIFLVEFFKCWKYPSNSSETFKILFLHQNNQFEAKTACFADFSILTKIAVSGPYRRGHFVGWFFGWVFQCWKYPSNSSETFKILFFHQNNQFEAKTACFADFSILTKIAVSGHYRRGHFVGWFFWLSFSNVENTLRILLKHSKFCSFIKTISLKQKQHVLRTFQFWPKSLYPDLTGVAIFLVDFFGWVFQCWKYPSNSSETFKILFLHQNNQFEAKTACFADFSILTKIAVSGPYQRGHFVGWIFWLSFSNVENTLRILLKHSKFCSFIKTISLKQKQHVLRTFQFWPKSLYPDLTGVAILLVDFFGWVFQMLKIPFEFFWNIQNFVLSSKQSVWSKNSMFCGLFNFDQNRCIRTLPAWPFCWLIFLVEFFKCWKYPSNSSETFKILFFHQNNQFEAKTACFADFSILTKIAVSGPYQRGHFFGWFFWLSFSNVENTLRILLKHSKFCSFIKTISLKQKQHVLRTFQFWPKSLYPDLTGVAILLVDFFGWVFQLLKIPFEFFWNIQNFVLSSKQSVWSKNSMFCGLFNFDQNRCIRTLPAWPFFWLIFWNVENTLRILLKHSKFCSFIKTISLKQKQHVLRTFQFWPKSLYPDLTGVAILLVDFFGWVFQMLKIPFEFFWNIQNFVLSSKQSVWSKNSMFCGLFNFDQNRCIRTLPAWPFFWLIFLVEFFKCWKYPSNSSETFKILFFHQNNQFEAKTACFADFSILTKIAVSGPYRRGHFFGWFFGWVFQCWKYPSNSSETFKMLFFHQNNQFEAKTACFADFSILTKIAVSGPYRRGHFVGWFFWLSFSNVENTLRILLKHSKFCSYIKTISLKQKQHVLRTFQFWPKSLYPDLTGVAIFWLIFLVDFLKCWKYPSNSSETFKMLFFHQNNQFEAKTACFADFSILTKIAVSGPYRRGHFFGWFFGWVFQCWKYPSNSSETFKILFLHQNNQFEAKTACFADFSILTKIAVSGPYRRGHFFGWFFENVENTLRILLKHSKFCSFIKTISLKQKQHVLRTFQFWPKSLYPDITSVAILLVDFFGWVFQMLKIPFEFFWNIQNFVLSSKQSVWSKNSMFCGLFNFDQNRCIRTLPAWPFFWLIFLVEFFKCWKYPSNSSETFKILFFHQNNQFEAKTACFADFSILTKIAVSGPYRRGHFVGWFFGWVFQMLKIPFEFFWNIQNFVLSSKQSVWSKNSMFCGLFNFDQNRCIRTLPAWPFFWLIFWLSFSNVENTLRILLKHSKFCSFIKTISLKQKQHVLRTFQFWPKSLYPDLTCVAIFLVDFLSFSNVENTLRILLKHSNFVLSSKQSVWSKNSMFCGLFNFDQNRCIRTLPAWPFCWLIFLVEFFKCWKYPSNSSETFKILFFHQNNQFEAKTACFADFSILTKIAVSGPYRRGHFFGWFFGWNVENTLRILLKHSKFCSFIKTISLKQKQHVLRTFQFWPKSLYPDLTGVAILLVDFLVEFFKCWKYPSNSSETFKILFFHQNNQFEAKTACFADFSILTKIAVSGHYQRGHFVGWFFWLLSFSNVENTLRILLKHSKFCSFIKTISLKQKQHVLRTFQFWPKSLYPDLTGVAILLVDFLVEMLKIPFEFFWNIQNFVLTSKQSVWSKNSMFCGLFNFDQNRCIRTLPAWPFFWLIFWNVENTLRILLKHSKFCSFIKTISLKQNSMFCGLFNFDQNRCIRTLPAWPFCWLIFWLSFFWNVENTLPILLKHSKFCSLHQKQSVWSKNSMFCGLFNFDQNRCIRTLPAWPFFWLIFWNVENTLPILLKHSKFCSFIKTISLKQKQHVLQTFQFWPKSLYPDITGVAILLVDFLVEFFKCWKYPSNSSETFKILFFHQNNQFEAKTACFADFSILTKIAVSGPYRRGHFLGWFFWLSFSMLKIPFEFFWNIQNFVLSSKQSVWSKNSMFCGLFNFDQNRCIRTLPAWPFCWLIFLVEFFKCWKYPSNSSETFKILFFHQNNQFEAKTACFADFSILTKIAVSGHYRRGHFVGWFFWLSFSNVENTSSNSSETFKILFFHQNNQFEAKTACFADFSILTKIAVSGPYRRGHFFGWFFEMLKIPFQFFWNIQNFVLSSKQSVWSKNSMFCRLSNCDQNRCIRTLPAWPFCWLNFLVEIFKCWKYPSNSSETLKMLFFHQKNQFEAKTACFAEFSIFTKIAVYGPYRRGHFVDWIFWLRFWNVENTLPNSSEILKILFFHQNNQFEAKTAFFADFSIVTKIAVSGPYRRGHFVGWFFWLSFSNCWKYPSNSSETFKILFFHQNNQFEAKRACFADFSIFTKIAVSGPYRRGHFVGWFFWLSFSNDENTLRILLKHSKCCSFIKAISLKQKQHVLQNFQFYPISLYPDLSGVAISWLIFFAEFSKCWKYPSNSSETFKFCSYIKTFSLKQKQHVLQTFQFWPKSLYPDLAGVAIFLVDFLKCWKYPSNSSETFKFCSYIKTISLKQNSMFCGLFNFDKYRCIRTLPAWPFCWLIFLVEFFKCWKYPSNSSETFKMLFFHQSNQLKQKQHVLQTFQFSQYRCILTLPA